MKNKEAFKELKLQSESELKKALAEQRERVRDLRFKSSQNQLKAVRQIREAKKTIARLMTAVSSAKKETK